MKERLSVKEVGGGGEERGKEGRNIYIVNTCRVVLQYF